MRLLLHPASARGGGVTPLAVLSMSLLVSVVAVAVDGGTLFENRRHVQASADAAALAAAADLFANYTTNQGTDPKGTAVAAALANAAANGFNNDGVQSIVTVNINNGSSPATYLGGPNAGKPLPVGYAEVIVQYNAGRTFSAIFGSGAVPVSARAVARGQWAPLSNAVTALSLNAGVALNINGFGLLAGLLSGLHVNGGLQVNSGSSTAIQLNGGASLNASQITLNPASGNLISTLVSLLKTLLGSPPPIVTSPPTPDPLRSLPDPDPVKLGLSVQSYAGGNADLYPGVYPGGLNISGSSTVTLHANADGTPGIYYLQGGGLSIAGSATVQTVSAEAGVMIYNDWNTSSDAVNVSASANLTLAPASTGIYAGISIFQERGSNASPAPPITVNSLGSLNVTGLIYGAHANVALTGNSSTNVTAGAILADTLTISGSAVVNIGNSGSGGPVAGTRVYGLVE